MTDLQEILETIKERVRNSLRSMTGVEPEVDEINSRSEPKRVPYARVGIAEAVHSDFTVSSDSLMLGLQIIAVVDRNRNAPQAVQFELAKALHEGIFGRNYELCLLTLSSGRTARLIPATRTTFTSDIEQELVERVPDCTSVVITLSAELPLGGSVY